MKHIPLSSGRQGFALVDDDDFATVSALKWQPDRHGKITYARHIHYIKGGKGTNTKAILLHRFVLGLHEQAFPFVDHIDANGLNCQKGNLRPCTNAQNQQNYQRLRANKTSRYKGVSTARQRRGKPWQAAICIDKKRIYLGSFDDEQEAAVAYDRAAVMHFGEFAATNFPLTVCPDVLPIIV